MGGTPREQTQKYCLFKMFDLSPNSHRVLCAFMSPHSGLSATIMSSRLFSALKQLSGFPSSYLHFSFHLADIGHIPDAAILYLHRVKDPLPCPDHPHDISFSLERVAVQEPLPLSSPMRQHLSEAPGHRRQRSALRRAAAVASKLPRLTLCV